MINYIDYGKLGREISPFDKIFMSLSSRFEDAQELAAAENLIMGNIRKFISVYQEHF